MPVIHDLALHFERINLDWISRENNKLADRVAKAAAEQVIGVTKGNPDLFYLTFNMGSILSNGLSRRK